MNTQDPLDSELKTALSGNVAFSPEEMARLNGIVVKAFDERQRKVKWVMYGYVGALMGIMLVMIFILMSMNDLKYCLLMSVAILIVYEGTVLMKLWFWVLHSKLSTLREIKQLQVQVADLAARLEQQKSQNH